MIKYIQNLMAEIFDRNKLGISKNQGQRSFGTRFRSRD